MLVIEDDLHEADGFSHEILDFPLQTIHVYCLRIVAEGVVLVVLRLGWLMRCRGDNSTFFERMSDGITDDGCSVLVIWPVLQGHWGCVLECG